MKRRTLLIGVGSSAIGIGATVGSGAFSQVDATRSIQVSVADDSTALLALTPGTASSDVVSANAGDSGNELAVDLDSTGVNDNAKTRIGSFVTSSEDEIEESAFEITNNGDSPVNVGVSLSTTGSNPGLELPTQVDESDHNVTTTDFTITKDLIANDIPELSAGGTAEVVVIVDTDDTDQTDDSVDSLTFTATKS